MIKSIYGFFRINLIELTVVVVVVVMAALVVDWTCSSWRLTGTEIWAAKACGQFFKCDRRSTRVLQRWRQCWQRDDHDVVDVVLALTIRMGTALFSSSRFLVSLPANFSASWSKKELFLRATPSTVLNGSLPLLPLVLLFLSPLLANNPTASKIGDGLHTVDNRIPYQYCINFDYLYINFKTK